MKGGAVSEERSPEKFAMLQRGDKESKQWSRGRGETDDLMNWVQVDFWDGGTA